ncbi:phage protein [Clostridium brassicae]|uniref:Uncharacterized protein n=1 Tax=Clostridium brassicae TaxID=2999072 RepID=A0ABT4D9Q3_9CLOT|nr:hypothetical protein [Clostridium brassicae]MCY6957901.1 hypothetical protein [Clostridium brassicae]
MSKFFDRKIEVIIGNRRWAYPYIDIDFSIKFDSDTIPDEAEVTLYNLSPTSVAQISKGTGIIVNAGYGTDTGTILSGVISDVFTSQNGVDKETKIKALNITQQYLNKTIYKTYHAGVKADYIIASLLALAGNLKANTLQLSNNVTYQRGFVASGKILNNLTRIARDCNSRFLVRGSAINFIPNQQGFQMGFLLSASTGLISVDKIDKSDSVATHKIEMLLNHAIAPYSLLQIKSKDLNGTVLVIEGEHKSDFTTSVEVRTL